MTEEVKKLLERADHALEVAEKPVKDGYPSDAVSKIYYSITRLDLLSGRTVGLSAMKRDALS